MELASKIQILFNFKCAVVLCLAKRGRERIYLSERLVSKANIVLLPSIISTAVTATTNYKTYHDSTLLCLTINKTDPESCQTIHMVKFYPSILKTQYRSSDH